MGLSSIVCNGGLRASNDPRFHEFRKGRSGSYAGPDIHTAKSLPYAYGTAFKLFGPDQGLEYGESYSTQQYREAVDREVHTGWMRCILKMLPMKQPDSQVNDDEWVYYEPERDLVLLSVIVLLNAPFRDATDRYGAYRICPPPEDPSRGGSNARRFDHHKALVDMLPRQRVSVDQEDSELFGHLEYQD